MSTKDVIEICIAALNLIAISFTAWFIFRSINSPIRAVEAGRRLDDDQKKDIIKRNLFFTLYSHRGNPVHQNFVAALNQIDIAFYDNQKVLSLWHSYYTALETKGGDNQIEIWKLHRTDLLSEMATSLGYLSLKQTDIMKFYYPEAHDSQAQFDLELREAGLNFLKNGDRVYRMMIEKTLEQEAKEKQQ